jgi:hypothetical protein
MTQDEIIGMARKSGFTVARNEWAFTEMLVAFAKLVEEKATATEREACAKVCDDAPEPDGADLAERIRARGQA